MDNLFDRRHLLRLAGASIMGAGLPATAQPMIPMNAKSGAAMVSLSAAPQGTADHTIRIGTGLVELGAKACGSTSGRRAFSRTHQSGGGD